VTVTIWELALYAGALFVLFIIPGPVWLAVAARTMTGGVKGAFPLALGVAFGDIIWPMVAILGVTWLVSVYADFMIVLKWIAVAMFLVLGFLVIRHAAESIDTNSNLTRQGMWAGFIAGIVAVGANPKAALFYMGLLPGFFDLTKITWIDIALILPVSAAVPFLGNMILAFGVDKARQRLTNPTALYRTNLIAGGLLICVAIVIAFT